MRQCPLCGRWFANVRNHLSMKHPGATVAASLGAAPAGPVPSASGSAPLPSRHEAKPARPAVSPAFVCDSCGARVVRGMHYCPGCGEVLEW